MAGGGSSVGASGGDSGARDAEGIDVVHMLWVGAGGIPDFPYRCIASYVAKNVVDGHRAKQEWLQEWEEVSEKVVGGKVVGLETEIGLTKSDRKQVGETKQLPCVTGCTQGLQLWGLHKRGLLPARPALVRLPQLDTVAPLAKYDGPV